CSHCDASTDKLKIVSHQIWTIQPILRPLSDLTKEIESGNNPSLISNVSMKDLRFIEQGKTQFISFMGVTELFKNHFDVFGLIEKGLAISYNDISN
ncbi:unnamed protein product, partial [marine sediment metagenome]